MYKTAVKRLLDLLLSIIALPFFGLALLIIAPLIYFEDKGPVFYNAPRVGKDRKLFKMYKFRTMRVNAPDLKMADGSTYNGADDPRLTKIGAKLRSSSLDEIPQVLNIIKGDMSLIGPRPDLESEVALYFEGEEQKLAVKPGITGFAQVYGRNAIAWHDRIALDLLYVQKISFALDTKIFFKTFAVVVTGEGVYVEEDGAQASTSTSDLSADSASTSASDLQADLASASASDLQAAQATILPPIELVSIVVMAHNEEACVSDLLGDIAAQDYPLQKIELLLIDSASSDNTKQIFVEFARLQQGFAAVRLLDNPGKYQPHGLNVALKAYTGDVFIRIDAHARIPQDFVRTSVAVLDGGYSACGGVRPVVVRESTPWRETLLLAEESAFGSSPAAYRRGGAPGEARSVFHGAYRRAVFNTVGHYNEKLIRTEDNDMSYRIRKAGFCLRFDPAINSEQYMRSSLPAMLKQKFSNGYWVGRTLWISPACLGLHHFVPLAFVLAIIVCLILGFFVSWLPLVALAALYALACIGLTLLAVVRAPRKFWQMLALPLVFLLIHLSYGAGTLIGIFRVR